MKIKCNSDDDLRLRKTVEFHNMIVVVRCVFHKNNKYKIYKCYILIELTFLRVIMLIRQVHQKSLIFFTAVLF